MIFRPLFLSILPALRLAPNTYMSHFDAIHCMLAHCKDRSEEGAKLNLSQVDFLSVPSAWEQTDDAL